MCTAPRMCTTPNPDLVTIQGTTCGKTAPILSALDYDACKDIASAIAPSLNIAICDVCSTKVTDGCYAWDEDGRLWCVPCMMGWELKNGCHWGNGQPMKEETK